MSHQEHRPSHTTKWGFDGERMQHELAAQLRALSVTSGSTAWLGNASVLRQLARVLAERLDDQVERIAVPSTPAHHTLGAALAYATGLRWTALDLHSARPVVGELHQGERLALIGIQAEDLALFQDKGTALEGQRLTVFATTEESAEYALFRVEATGGFTPTGNTPRSVTQLPSFFDLTRGEPTPAADEPAEIERLGCLLALHLEPIELDAVLVWRGDRYAALAQVVASRRGIRVLRADEDLGLLSVDGKYRAGDRIVLIDAPWAPAGSTEPLLGLAANSALDVVATLSVASGSAPDEPAHVVMNTFAETHKEISDATDV